MTEVWKYRLWRLRGVWNSYFGYRSFFYYFGPYIITAALVVVTLVVAGIIAYLESP